MAAEIRKTLLHVENTLIEGGKAAAKPLKLIAAIAVIRNPWAGAGFVEDLGPEIRNCAPAPDELLIALGASIGGRPHHRIGDRYQDLKERGHDA